MAYGDTFTTAIQALAARRRLQGRTLTRGEVAGVAEGVASTASERAARMKALELQEESLAETQRANLVRESQINKSQELAEEQAKTETRLGAATAGAAIGGYVAAGTSVGGPYGAAIGAAVGIGAAIVGEGSYFCGVLAGLHPEVVPPRVGRRMIMFQKWVERNHPKWYDLYAKTAPEILRAMAERLGNKFGDALLTLKPTLIDKVVDLMKLGEPERAFNVYRKAIIDTAMEYTPEFKRQVDELRCGDDMGVNHG